MSNVDPSNHERPQAETNPLPTAYRLGRLLQRLDFVARQYCLGTRVASEVHYAFDRLRSTARATVPAISRRLVQSAIEVQFEVFLKTVRSEAWSENWQEQEDKFKNRFVSDLESENICEEILRPVDCLISELRNAFAGFLDQRAQTALDFGSTAERGQCSWDAYSSRIGSFGATTRQLAADPFRGDNGTVPRLPAVASNCELHVVRLPSLNSWLDELRQLWRELGFEDQVFPPWAHDVDTAEIPGRLESFLSHLASAIDQVSASNSAGDTIQRTEPGFLGLFADIATCRVTRTGVGPIEIRSRLKLEILKVLIAKRGGFTNRADLRQTAWAKADLNTDPEDGTIDNEISELRSLIGPLGIRIANERRLGWRLEEIADYDLTDDRT